MGKSLKIFIETICKEIHSKRYLEVGGISDGHAQLSQITQFIQFLSTSTNVSLNFE